MNEQQTRPIFCNHTWFDTHTRPARRELATSRHGCVEVDTEGQPRHEVHVCCCGERIER